MNSSNSLLFIADFFIKDFRLSTNFIESLYIDNIVIEIKYTLIKYISNSYRFATPQILINFQGNFINLNMQNLSAHQLNGITLIKL
jgi:hypothetical protein